MAEDAKDPSELDETGVWQRLRPVKLTKEIDGGAGGINRPIQIASAPFDPYIGFVDPPRFVSRLEMPSHSLFQFGSIALDPAPHGRVISAQTTLNQQFFYVTER